MGWDGKGELAVDGEGNESPPLWVGVVPPPRPTLRAGWSQFLERFNRKQAIIPLVGKRVKRSIYFCPSFRHCGEITHSQEPLRMVGRGGRGRWRPSSAVRPSDPACRAIRAFPKRSGSAWPARRSRRSASGVRVAPADGGHAARRLAPRGSAHAWHMHMHPRGARMHARAPSRPVCPRHRCYGNSVLLPAPVLG